jgi:hypothetical protein
VIGQPQSSYSVDVDAIPETLKILVTIYSVEDSFQL